MSKRVALLRGINVGGHHLVPMAELRRDLELAGLGEVRTYIQSGNVVFDASTDAPATVADRIATVIADAHGFRPQVVVLETVELQRAVEQNPFPGGEPKAVQLYFLTEPATPDEQAIEALRANSERYVAAETVFYLHAPDGIGRSKLAAKVERCLGVATTARNLRTVNKLLAMAAEA